MNTPIVMIVFNRPECTEKVFDVVRRCKPPELYLIADGPRSDREGEAERCAEVRAIVENIDWPCNVHKNYSDKNLGCKTRISSGLDWVFNEVEDAIILEDDCLPNISFFRFCDEMLEKYRTDERIGHISGDNFQFGKHELISSYYFSHHTHVWGWATWRRAWKDYDLKMNQWPLIRDSGFLENCYTDKRVISYWRNRYTQVYDGDIDTWDYQWNFCNLINDRLCIMPCVNMVRNIGFGESATHTKSSHKTSDVQSEAMAFPLIHPELVIRDTFADHNTDLLYLPLSRWKRKIRRLRRLFGLTSE
jgi:hypothetical protein